MIVTSMPRSGSTKYCIDLATNLNLPLYDEIFEIDVDATHKQTIHETMLDRIHPKTIEFIQSLDFDQCIINNHEINFFTLLHTDVFLSRHNVQDSVWSYIAYTDKYISRILGITCDARLRLLVSRYLKRIILFYEYCIINNKKIVISNLEFTDTSIYRSAYPQFTDQINKFKDTLNLPSGLVFE